MQATVFSFDEQTQSGTVVLDSGRQLAFTREVFAASGLRLLRLGQRVRIETLDDRVAQLTIITLPMPGQAQL